VPAPGRNLLHLVIHLYTLTAPDIARSA